MREPDPDEPRDSEGRDGQRREEAGTRVFLQASADEDDVQVDDDEERDAAKPDANRIAERPAAFDRCSGRRDHAGGSLEPRFQRDISDAVAGGPELVDPLSFLERDEVERSVW